MQKKGKVNLPDGDRDKSSKLEKQINSLEETITEPTPSRPRTDLFEDMINQSRENVDGVPPKKQSFTEFANDNNIKPTNYKKTLWKKAGNDLTDEESEGFSEENTVNDRDTLDEFKNSDSAGRKSLYTDSFEDMKSSVAAVDEFTSAPVRGDNVSRLGNVARETFKGIHPINMGVGIISSALADQALDFVDKDHKQPEVLRVAETGVLAGGIGAGLTGGALLPEAIAGGAGYLAGTYSQKGITAGLEGIGVGKDPAEAIGSFGGGAVGGAVAVGAGSLAASLFGGAAAGAEEGGILGGGVFSVETAAIGAAVGGLVGLGSYLYQKLK